MGCSSRRYRGRGQRPRRQSGDALRKRWCADRTPTVVRPEAIWPAEVDGICMGLRKKDRPGKQLPTASQGLWRMVLLHHTGSNVQVRVGTALRPLRPFCDWVATGTCTTQLASSNRGHLRSLRSSRGGYGCCAVLHHGEAQRRAIMPMPPKRVAVAVSGRSDICEGNCSQ